jgi:4-amino-4-deoxy-L-arabinose transferase-like glycosyltransferase
MKAKHLWLVVLILLLAFLLRVGALTEIPPGLTHDEANHGREAFSILGGDLALFFPLNYGSEPLYSYTVAGLMGVAGRHPLALRLVNVYFGVLTIALTYLWGCRTLGRPVGLLAAGLMAVSFWPVAASREALRAGMMPFFTVAAVFFYWEILRRAGVNDSLPAGKPVRRAFALAGFALCLTATFYNYLASRVLWLLFPLFLLYLGLWHRPVFRRSWRATVGGLLLVGLAVVPMFWYLQNNPEAQTRLSMLDSTLATTLSGEIVPLVENAGEALLAFVWPGQGDQFLAYNIPGRPVFTLLSALFFLIGVGVCFWRWRRPAYFFLLLWFLVGIAPSLITGPTANTTRNVGAYSATFLLPAVGFWHSARYFQQRLRPSRQAKIRPVLGGLALLWLLLVLVGTVRDYFLVWGQSPEVRAAYQSTLIAGLESLEDEPVVNTLVISSVYPGPAHNPSIALVTTGTDGNRRWVDARLALVLPADAHGQLLALAATPLHPQFTQWVQPGKTVQLRPDDLNPGFTLYSFDLPADWLVPLEPSVPYGQGAPAIELVSARWLGETARSGDVVELLTVWRVLDPAGVGPVVPPSFTTDVVLFTHVLRPDGTILTQQDRLDAPSWDWQAGDYVVQIHQMTVPPDAPAGSYPAVVGIYDRASGNRLPLWPVEVHQGETRASIPPLVVE